MNIDNYIGHSGGAIGSDHYWGKVAAEYGVKVNHYWHGNKTPFGNVELTDAQIEEGWQHVLQANKTLKRRPEAYKNLLSRNWFQVKDSFILLAVGEIDFVKQQVKGGTGWAVQMAIDKGMTSLREGTGTIAVFDQPTNMWYNFYDDMFHNLWPGPYLFHNFGCIGTRDLKDNGKAAIRKVFTDTIKLTY